MGGGRAATDLNGVFMHFVNLDLGKSIAFGSEKKVVLKCLVVICGQVGMSQVHVSEPLCNRCVLNVQDSMAGSLGTSCSCNHSGVSFTCASRFESCWPGR